jgi:hypothetical protein
MEWHVVGSRLTRALSSQPRVAKGLERTWGALSTGGSSGQGGGGDLVSRANHGGGSKARDMISAEVKRLELKPDLREIET